MTFLTCDGEEGTSVPPWKKSRTYHMLKNRNTWQIPDNILTCRSISVVTIQQSPVSWPSLVPAFIRQGCSNTSSSLAPQLRRPGWVCLRRTSNALSITPPPHFPILLHNNPTSTLAFIQAATNSSTTVTKAIKALHIHNGCRLCSSVGLDHHHL